MAYNCGGHLLGLKTYNSPLKPKYRKNFEATGKKNTFEKCIWMTNAYGCPVMYHKEKGGSFNLTKLGIDKVTFKNS